MSKKIDDLQGFIDSVKREWIKRLDLHRINCDQLFSRRLHDILEDRISEKAYIEFWKYND